MGGYGNGGANPDRLTPKTPSSFSLNANDSSGGMSYEYAGHHAGERGDRMTGGLNPGSPSFRQSTHKRTDNTRRGPAWIFLLYDGDTGCSNVPGCDQRNNRPDPVDNHGVRGLNFLYADGHVAFMAGVKAQARHAWELSQHDDPFRRPPPGGGGGGVRR